MTFDLVEGVSRRPDTTDMWMGRFDLLDLSGGMSAVGCGLGFLHVAAIALLGQVAFMLLGPRDLGGNRRSAERHPADCA